MNLRELRQKFAAMVADAKKLTEEGKLEEAKAKTEEAKAINEQIKQAEEIEKMEEELNQDAGTPVTEPVENKKADVNKAFIKAITGKKLTPAENALIEKADEDDPNGSILVPTDENTRINEYKRQYKSLRTHVREYRTTVVTGSFVYENNSTMSLLTDIDEMEEIPQEDGPKFKTKGYSIKNKGAILPVSNTLLSDEQSGLMAYVGRWFARKAVKTENADILAVMKADKTAKELADWKALKRSLNKDIDPALIPGSVIITNQDGFDELDNAVDENGRPILQPDPKNPTQKMFKGLTIDVYSNNDIPSKDGKAPVFYGNLEEAITFVNRERYEIAKSKEAGFTKNATLIRILERYDVIKTDNEAYIYGELAITDGVAVTQTDKGTEAEG
jgi:HK97 family phage major capsid protein